MAHIGGMVMSLVDLSNVDEAPVPSCVSPTKEEDDTNDPDNFEGTCQGNSGIILEGSCIDGEHVCTRNSNNIDDGACQTDMACFENEGEISSGACSGIETW